MYGALFVNNNQIAYATTERIVVQVANLPSTSSGLIRLAAGDVIDFRVKCESNAGETITIHKFRLCLHKIAQ